jgi:hypothetical protein
VVVPLVAGVLLLAAFTINALRTAQVPLIDVRLLGRRNFAAASGSMFAAGFVLFGAMGALPLSYQIARGFTAERAGPERGRHRRRLVPIMTASFVGLAHAAVPRASSSIRIRQQLGGSFGSASLLIIVQHQLAAHAPTAAGLSAAFGATFWWVAAFTVLMLVPVLFLPGRER